MNFTKPLLASAMAGAISLTSCGPKNEFAPPPPPTVTVANPAQRDQIVYETYPATLTGIAEVEVRARVKGILEEIYFKEGTVIEEGDKLFAIEPDIYKANKEGALADIDQAKAQLRLSIANLSRLEKAGPRAVSELDLEKAHADVDNAKAVLKLAEAQLLSTEIDLSYTNIEAPLSGRTSRTLVDRGNLVGNSEPTLLTTVVDESSIRAYFEVPERTMLEFYRKRAADHDFGKKLNQVNLELADGTVYSQMGTLDYIENKVNASTRTAQVRAVFPNPNGELSSGLFAEVGYPRNFKDAILVPAVAVLRDIGGSFVWVVDEQNTVKRVGVVTGPTVNKPQEDPDAVPIRETIILKGLQASDRVITRGVQRVREEAKVTPQMEGETPPQTPAQQQKPASKQEPSSK
ncbi:efflux RND transporter periplasmic adaptor subunit [Rubritalea marina]|uniref:efflux RND transporter periplasmic adaptor subunit n=1 Tax=Rubritalea marina TaxID=361055 RepID=UPI00035C62D4|nr:efflux RND transporter periplasmic adaptor subunit [Rubritalea marina]